MAVSAVYARITHLSRYDGKGTLDAPRAFSNISATTAAFLLSGGLYAVDVMGTSFGSVTLQKLGPDGSTYVDVKQAFEKADGTGGTVDNAVIAAFAANGSKNLTLGAGTYKLTLA